MPDKVTSIPMLRCCLSLGGIGPKRDLSGLPHRQEVSFISDKRSSVADVDSSSEAASHEGTYRGEQRRAASIYIPWSRKAQRQDRIWLYNIDR